jgi:hypothetical protein
MCTLIYLISRYTVNAMHLEMLNRSIIRSGEVALIIIRRNKKNVARREDLIPIQFTYLRGVDRWFRLRLKWKENLIAVVSGFVSTFRQRLRSRRS